MKVRDYKDLDVRQLEIARRREYAGERHESPVTRHRQ